MTDLGQAYKLFEDGAGPGDSPYWMPGGVYGGVPMSGGRKRKTLVKKSKKNKSSNNKKYKRKHNHQKKTMRKFKKYSRKNN
jgi:hypothetical protein